jgi:purine nucleosidase
LKNIIALIIVLATSIIVPAQEKQKIIFDCDFAGDIDDAFAVALILSSPEFEILGLIMDHGNTPLRARTACKLIYEAGRDDIPVIVGKPTPAIVGVDKEIAGYSYQFYWSEDFNKLKPDKTNVADFIIENLNKYPHEIILFTVGPVCNIKEILQKDKNVLKLAKKVVSMFGSFYMGYNAGPVPDAEWNVRADVEASKMLTSSGANILYAGLDVSAFVKLDEKNLNRLLFRQSPLTNSMCGLYSLWRYESYSQPEANLFDVVAVGAVLWPELFSGKKTNVRVNEKGYTLVDDSIKPNGEILLTINKDEFIKRIMER